MSQETEKETSIQAGSIVEIAGPAVRVGHDWLRFDAGTRWICAGEQVCIEKITALDRVIVRKALSEECIEVGLSDLHPLPIKRSQVEKSVEPRNLTDKEIDEAKVKEQCFSPYLDGEPLTNEQRNSLADQFKVDVSTIKRWLCKYRKVRHWSAFINAKRGSKPGVLKLDETREAIIDATIREQVGVSNDFTANSLINSIRVRCEAAGIDAPSLKAVRVRVKAHFDDASNLPSDIREERARESRLVKGQLVTDKALALVQVDHTPCDVPVICPVSGKEIGCPYLTIVFDVHTRVVLGFCLTLEAPSQLSTALALHHAVFPKDAWRAQQGIELPWDFFGIMSALHMDNAAEFVSPHFERALKSWGIQPFWRALGHPQHGAHIERFLGTLLARLHRLTGATKYKKQRRRRRPEKSHHTLDSLRTQIALEIIDYHHDFHKGIQRTPVQAWRDAWMTPEGLRLPPVPRDERTFLISFLPGQSRVVSRQGIAWKGLHYRCPDLEPYIARARRRVFRYDKRDISRIFFERPEGGFLEVPWTQANYPRMSEWEWDELRPQLRVKTSHADALIVHQAQAAKRELNRRQMSKSQKARRRGAREAEWISALLPESLPQPPLRAVVTSTDSPLAFEVLE